MLVSDEAVREAWKAYDTILAEVAEPNEAMQINGCAYTVSPRACWHAMLAASPLGGQKDG